MKFFVVSQRNQVPMPLERAVELYQAAKAWTNARVADGTIDCVYSFADLSGGMVIGNADSPEELLDLLVDYPQWPFFGWEIKPVSDFDHTMDKLTEYFEKIAGQQSEAPIAFEWMPRTVDPKVAAVSPDMGLGQRYRRRAWAEDAAKDLQIDCMPCPGSPQQSYHLLPPPSMGSWYQGRVGGM